MKSHYDIIRKPLITEKSYSLLNENKYTFLVDPRANKTEIKQAIEKIFKVKVEKVNTMTVRGRLKRVRTAWGKTAERKKAIVKLRQGDKIEGFEAL